MMSGDMGASCRAWGCVRGGIEARRMRDRARGGQAVRRAEPVARAGTQLDLDPRREATEARSACCAANAIASLAAAIHPRAHSTTSAGSFGAGLIRDACM